MTTQGILALPLARTATETFIVEGNDAVASNFIIDIVTGASASDTITVTIDGYDAASKTWYNILTSAALNSNAQTILKVGLVYSAETNLVAKEFLPRKYRVVATKNNATSIKYSIGLNQFV